MSLAGMTTPPLRNVLLAGLMFIASMAFAHRTSSQEFTLRGKQVTLYASSGPGGGIGNYARPLLPFMTKYLPGNPDIVMSGMPGGGGLQAVQYLYNVAKRDGTAFGVFSPAPLNHPFLSTIPVNYEIEKFHWIGSLSSSATSCFVFDRSPIRSLQDAQAREVTLSVPGADSGQTRVARLSNGLLGTKFKTIAGYNGTGETMLAAERGEVDGSCNSFNSLRGSGHLANGSLRFLLQATAGEKDPNFAQVPSIMDLVQTESDRAAVRLLLTPYSVQYPFALPPDVPPTVIDVYRKAFDLAVADPEYLASAVAQKQEISPQKGSAVEGMVRSMATTPDSVRQYVISLISKD